jgi:hypothetical protein
MALTTKKLPRKHAEEHGTVSARVIDFSMFFRGRCYFIFEDSALVSSRWA